jgi:hypothetical protein
MSDPTPPAVPAEAAALLQVAEVRYSLPALLRELTVERAAGTFAMEKLDQTEIGKLFKNKAQRRAKPKK